jgi:hypothetical protein
MPRLFAALGIALALRAGLWNIGAEGQLYVGAIAAAGVALFGPDLGVLTVVAALLAGIGAGAVWGAIPGVLRAGRGINEGDHVVDARVRRDPADKLPRGGTVARRGLDVPRLRGDRVRRAPAQHLAEHAAKRGCDRGRARRGGRLVPRFVHHVRPAPPRRRRRRAGGALPRRGREVGRDPRHGGEWRLRRPRRRGGGARRPRTADRRVLARLWLRGDRDRADRPPEPGRHRRRGAALRRARRRRHRPAGGRPRVFRPRSSRSRPGSPSSTY